MIWFVSLVLSSQIATLSVALGFFSGLIRLRLIVYSILRAEARKYLGEIEDQVKQTEEVIQTETPSYEAVKQTLTKRTEFYTKLREHQARKSPPSSSCIQ